MKRAMKRARDHANMPDSEFIPKVSAELVMKANDVVTASNIKGDTTFAIVAALLISTGSMNSRR